MRSGHFFVGEIQISWWYTFVTMGLYSVFIFVVTTREIYTNDGCNDDYDGNDGKND